MDNHKFHHRVNPRLNANIFSKLFFCWIFPYISYGNKNELDTEDMFELAPENKSEFLGDKLEKCWEIQVQEAKRNQCKPSFRKVIVKTFGRYYLKCAIVAVASTLTPMFLPLLLKRVISHFYVTSTSSTLEACFYVALFMLLQISHTMLLAHSYHLMYYIEGQVKTACSSLIYKKLLRLRINDRDRSNGGKIMTLLSNDVAQFDDGFLFLHLLPIIPLIIFINGFIMWRASGIIAIFITLILTLEYIPFEVYSACVTKKLREKIARTTDRRLLLLDEIINGIRLIKMYTWEKPFEQLMFLARRKELDLKMKKLCLMVGLNLFYKFGQCFTMYLIIAILISYDKKVTSSSIFFLFQSSFELTLQLGVHLTKCLMSLANMTASINRIEDFLLLEEVTPVSKLLGYDEQNIITMKHVCFSRLESGKCDILQDISISIHANKLYVVIGEIGSGKSSLLKVILGELKPNSGQVLRYGDISFASQDPWLFNGSIRSNILFGEPFNEEKYNKVISSCALVKDFERLPYGDKTIVGERGTALSGGQCARINLARLYKVRSVSTIQLFHSKFSSLHRAVYKKADVYLLDDPLTSIDHDVGKCLFEKCINGLLKDKTRIFVSHKLEHIKKADEIILIKDGQLKYEGDYTNFQKTNFFQYLLKNVEVDAVSKGNVSSIAHLDDLHTDEIPETKETEELLSDYKENVQLQSYKDQEENIEQIKRGVIQFSLLKELYKNKALIICTVIIFISFRCSISTFEYLVTVWSRNQDEYFDHLNSTVTYELKAKTNFSDSQITLFYIIGGIVVSIFLSFTIFITLFIKLHKVSCQRLHDDMMSKLIGAAIKFFDNNDSGRILNRFSEDLGVVDEKLALSMYEITVFTISLIAAISQIIIVSPYMSIPIIISVFLAYKSTIFFGKIIRLTKRLEARAKALVLSHGNSTFNGLITIRSSAAQKAFQKYFNIRQDNYVAARFTNVDVFVSYCLWMEIIAKLLSVVIAFSFVFLKFTGIAAAIVGHVIFQMEMFTKYIVYLARVNMLFELSMISTERTLEYTQLEDENATSENFLTKSPNIWPTDGRIQFNHLHLKYPNSVEPVLKNINFVIEPQMKVGIIGRTGAGKSSLLTALFRLVETNGSLYVDGIDTKTLPLKDVRSKISVFPQKSVLFSTSLRKNLDPLEMFDDAQIWSALKCVNLDNIFHSLDEELDQRSISNGQRQLLCLARVILKKNKVLILDEATSNIDARMEELINDTIEEKFKDCTVLKIAHKLNSVIDCDKILVIDAGEVIEYDDPKVLLRQKNSYFYKMYQALNNNSL